MCLSAAGVISTPMGDQPCGPPLWWRPRWDKLAEESIDDRPTWETLTGCMHLIQWRSGIWGQWSTLNSLVILFALKDAVWAAISTMSWGPKTAVLRGIEELRAFHRERSLCTREIEVGKNIKERYNMEIRVEEKLKMSKNRKNQNRTGRLSCGSFCLLVESRDFIWTWLISLVSSFLLPFFF